MIRAPPGRGREGPAGDRPFGRRAPVQDTIGPAVYLTAGALTLPAGVFIYPGLWANVLVVGLLVHLMGLEAGAEDDLTLAGVVVEFSLAALANALLARELWRARPVSDS